MRGLTSGVPLWISIEDIVSEREKGVQVAGSYRLISKRKVESLLILFHFKNILPKKVFLGMLSYSVTESILPPPRCFKSQHRGPVSEHARRQSRILKMF